jgi:hypothetical protein
MRKMRNPPNKNIAVFGNPVARLLSLTGTGYLMLVLVKLSHPYILRVREIRNFGSEKDK